MANYNGKTLDQYVEDERKRSKLTRAREIERMIEHQRHILYSTERNPTKAALEKIGTKIGCMDFQRDCRGRIADEAARVLYLQINCAANEASYLRYTSGSERQSSLSTLSGYLDTALYCIQTIIKDRPELLS